ncbi:hypothetical protein [Terricaulis silvestris]|uniref:Uncharacterized protein n=1 Tax=Terricaulis silvestris TaxID=2686094 RepID=A0A6I6MKA6_9CAUL|nr:hypothetical protein [Terricaulis silvestris]QGZ93556.1 hypothetical protein DSM104635_00368 [Terricaulis silvestris]
MSANTPERRANGTFTGCGCIHGRRGKSGKRKAPAQAKIDPHAEFYGPMGLRDANGVERQESAFEIAFAAHVAKAKNNVRSARHILKECLEAGVVEMAARTNVVVCPPGMTLEVARLLIERHGGTEWSQRQIDAASAALAKGESKP